SGPSPDGKGELQCRARPEPLSEEIRELNEAEPLALGTAKKKMRIRPLGIGGGRGGELRAADCGRAHGTARARPQSRAPGASGGGQTPPPRRIRTSPASAPAAHRYRLALPRSLRGALTAPPCPRRRRTRNTSPASLSPPRSHTSVTSPPPPSGSIIVSVSPIAITAIPTRYRNETAPVSVSGGAAAMGSAAPTGTTRAIRSAKSAPATVTPITCPMAREKVERAVTTPTASGRAAPCAISV